MSLNECLQGKHFMPQRLGPWPGREKEKDRDGIHCLQVTPLWPLCEVTCTQPPHLLHLYTWLRWCVIPLGEGAVRLSLLSPACCPVCVFWSSGTVRSQDGHHKAGAHLPPQGSCDRWVHTCVFTCRNPEATSLFKFSLETGSLTEPRAPMSCVALS